MSENKNNRNPLEELFGELLEALAKVIQIFIEKGLPLIITNIRESIREKSFKRLFLNPKTEISIADLKKIKKIDMKEGVWGYLVKQKRFMSFNETDTSKHVLVVGASGSGKSNFVFGLMEKSAIEDRPVVLIDPKGALEELQNFIALAKKFNRKFYVFDPNYNGEGKVFLNPFMTMDHRAVSSNLNDVFNYSDDFYKMVAKNSITKVVNVIKNENTEEWDEEMISLRKKMKLKYGDLGNTVSLKKIYFGLTTLFSNSKDHFGVIGNVESLINGRIGEMLSDSFLYETKSLTDIVNENAWVYVGLNKQKYASESSSVGKLFFQEILYISGDRQQKSINPRQDFKSLTFIVEEFSSVVTKQLPELTSKARSSGIEVVLAQQSLSDSDNVEGINSLKEIIVDHIGMVAVFRQAAPKNAEFLSQIIGTENSEKKTKQINNEIETTNGSTREVEQYLVHPNVVKSLPMGVCVLINFKSSNKTTQLLQVRNFKIGEENYKNEKTQQLINKQVVPTFEGGNISNGTLENMSLVVDSKTPKSLNSKNRKPVIDNKQIDLFEVY